MGNPILISEGFERAVSNFQHDALPRLESHMSGFGDNVEIIRKSVDRFSEAIDKLVRAMGMQAENEQRKVIGAAMAYTESAFENL